MIRVVMDSGLFASLPNEYAEILSKSAIRRGDLNGRLQAPGDSSSCPLPCVKQQGGVSFCWYGPLIDFVEVKY